MSRSVESVSIGSCGEYFVSAELERRGFTVAVPMANSINFDLLAYPHLHMPFLHLLLQFQDFLSTCFHLILLKNCFILFNFASI